MFLFTLSRNVAFPSLLPPKYPMMHSVCRIHLQNNICGGFLKRNSCSRWLNIASNTETPVRYIQNNHKLLVSLVVAHLGLTFKCWIIHVTSQVTFGTEVLSTASLPSFICKMKTSLGHRTCLLQCQYRISQTQPLSKSHFVTRLWQKNAEKRIQLHFQPSKV